MTNVKDLIKKIESGDISYEEKLAALSQVEATLKELKEKKEQRVQFNVQLIIDEIKKVKADVQSQIEYARSIVPERGPKGDPGERGQDGVIGKDGRDGRDGKDGKDGVDGQDGVSVTDAKIDFDGSLVITLSTGREINVGEVVTPELAEQIKVTMSTNSTVAIQDEGNTLTSGVRNINFTGSGVTVTGSADAVTVNVTGGGGGGGGVSSVDVSGGTTGLTTSGGPITTSGTITLAGTLAVANGGTGAVDATNARTNLSAQKIITSGSAAPSGGVDGDIYLQDTVGTIDIATQTYGTLNLLTRTSGATANQLMYGGASGQVAQSAGMVWDQANTRLTVADKIGVGNIEVYSNGLRKIANPALAISITGGSIVAPDTGEGGSVNINAGNARTIGTGGSVEFFGGTGAGVLPGGNVQATGGASSLTGTDSSGGSVIFLGGDSSRSNGYGGDVQLIAGNSTATSGGYGGTATLSAGSVDNTTGVPGGVSLSVGENNAGVVGSFSFSAGLGSPVAVAAGTGTTHAADLPVTVDGVQYYIRLYS